VVIENVEALGSELQVHYFMNPELSARRNIQLPGARWGERCSMRHVGQEHEIPGHWMESGRIFRREGGTLKLLAPTLVAVRVVFLWIFAKLRWLTGTNAVFFGTIS
jgi:hypothetical protein